jgi:hypothetical protein
VFRWKAKFLRKGKLEQVRLNVLSSPNLYNMYKNDANQTPAVYLALFADDTCTYATDRKDPLLPQKSSVVSGK